MNMERIVIASRGITEVTTLKEELEEAKMLTEKYRKEVNILRKFNITLKNLLSINLNKWKS